MLHRLQPGRFFGLCVASRTVAEAKLTESEYSAGLRIADHTHEAPYFSLVIAGAYTEHCDGAKQVCTSGTAIYHPPGERHSNQFSDRAGRLFMIEPSKSWLRMSLEYGVPLERRLVCSVGCISGISARIHDELATNDELAQLAIQGLLLELSASLKRAAALRGRTPPAWLVRCQERLRSCCQRAIRMEELAAGEGVHPVELARNFRRYYGCTPGDYLRRMRVEGARRLLRESNEALVNIALDCGFSSQSHLTTAFRRIVGLTPAAYRRIHNR